MTTLPVTYGLRPGSARPTTIPRNLETPAAHPGRARHPGPPGLHRRGQRPGWQALMEVLQAGDTVVVAFLDRFSRNFEEGVRIQADLTRGGHRHSGPSGRTSTREREAPPPSSSGGLCWPRGPTRWDSASERIKLGLERARAEGKRVGRPPALSSEQLEQCRRMAEEGAGLRQIARVLGCSPATVKKALAPYHNQSGSYLEPHFRRYPPWQFRSCSKPFNSGYPCFSGNTWPASWSFFHWPAVIRAGSWMPLLPRP